MQGKTVHFIVEIKGFSCSSAIKEYKMITQEPQLPQLEFMNTIYRKQCPYCYSIRVRCKIHSEADFAAEYTKRLYHHEVGQNLSLVKIDTDYFHQFDCIISEECEQAQCHDCRVIFRNGEITWHTQFLRIRILESGIVSAIR